MKRSLSILAAAAATTAVLAGCGGSSTSSTPTPTARSLVTGVASVGSKVGAVVVMDASSPSRQSFATVEADGSFSADVTGLTPPFLIKAVPWSATVDTQYALARGAGRASVNPLTTVAVLGASGGSGKSALGTAAGLQRVASGFEDVLGQLGSVLQPLLAQYGIGSLTSPGGLGLDALLGDVRFTVHGDTLLVTDAATNQVIFQGSLLDLAGGTFDPSGLPSLGTTGTSSPAAGSADGAAIYAQKCASCHGSLTSSEKRGRSASDIEAAHPGELTAAQADAVAAALGGSGSAPAPGGSGTSSGSGSSSSSGSSGATGSSSGAGAILDGVALYDRYCGSCHGAIGTSSVAGKTLEKALLFMSAGLSVDKLQAIIDAANAAAGGATSSSGGASSSGAATSSGGSTSGGSTAGVDGASVYAQRCASCHGDLSSSGVRGTTASAIQAKHPGKLTSTEATAVAQALSSASSSAGAGNCGALDGVALYNKYCAMCHGGAISKSSLPGMALDGISKFMSLGLSKLQLQAIVDVVNGTSSTACPAAGSP